MGIVGIVGIDILPFLKNTKIKKRNPKKKNSFFQRIILPPQLSPHSPTIPAEDI